MHNVTDLMPLTHTNRLLKFLQYLIKDNTKYTFFIPFRLVGKDEVIIMTVTMVAIYL